MKAVVVDESQHDRPLRVREVAEPTCGSGELIEIGRAHV
jgi:hypothetical protein